MSDDPDWLPSFGDEPTVSYSQNAEDIRLWRVFRTVENGFYVDIGAAYPRVDSVTHLFYEKGWSGINVEPSPCYEALKEARPRDVNLRVLIGEAEGSVPFFLTYPYLGMSTADPSVHQHVHGVIDRMDEVRIDQRRLDSILREHAGNRTIHFLKVDVEGGEYHVLASSDWASFRPMVVVVESIQSLSTAPSYQKWEHILLDAGYRFAAFDGINRFYVERSQDQLVSTLAYPISPLDRFVTAAVRDLEGEVERKTREVETLRQALESLPPSRTWSAGRITATAATRFRAAWVRLKSLASR